MVAEISLIVGGTWIIVGMHVEDGRVERAPRDADGELEEATTMTERFSVLSEVSSV